MILYHNVGIKHSLIDKIFVYLWYKHLGHIFKERMERLIKNENFPNLDFTGLKVCIDCIKGKTNKNTLRKELQEVHNFMRLCTLTSVDLLMLHLLVKRNILSPLLMIFHDMVIFIYCMTNLNQSMHLKCTSMRLRDN